MIIHCDACGKSVSNRLEKCPFCTFSIHMNTGQSISQKNLIIEELIPAFQRKSILS
ncbi:MAG: hypothetical protein Q8O95_00440 [bacterium]|nr:hypothetical protein [bacterium]